MVAAELEKQRKGTGGIRASDISKAFNNTDGDQTIALNNLNAEIRAGEFVCLIGPSGCGKSTFLRLVAGLSRPTQGEIYLDDQPITGPGYERGLVFQDPTLFPWLNIHDNIAYGLRIRHIYREHKRDVEEFVRLVGLRGFEKSYPHQLSGGMAQRASLARALVNNPKVLLLDEPLGALDAFTRMNMQDEILRIWKERGTTMLMVTHDVDEAIYLSDRIFVMTPRPARIEEIIEVDIGRGENYGRQRDSADFLRIRSRILQILDFTGKSHSPEYYL
jgi:ABC-type nitrate/sulfonate/bicarbonate transport system ATPase subunit